MLVSKVEITLKSATWCTAALTGSDLLWTYLSITVKMCKDVDRGEIHFKANNVNGGKQM